MSHMKSTCIINEASALHLLQETVSAMKDNMFCLATDGSNDIGSQKMNLKLKLKLKMKLCGFTTLAPAE